MAETNRWGHGKMAHSTLRAAAKAAGAKGQAVYLQRDGYWYCTCSTSGTVVTVLRNGVAVKAGDAGLVGEVERELKALGWL